MMRFMIRFGTALLLVLCVARAACAAEPKHVTVIVNQVRGPECCDAGTIAHVQQQVDALSTYTLPATFALRYDAVIDPTFQVYFQQHKEKFEIGAFLEVTPALAKAGGAEYKGDTEKWYEAEHAYLIGYQPEQRIKIIDAYMKSFMDAFGFYPKTTVAWMIDPISLTYLQEKYGVKVHEITREQWGTDSYTLYGGPAHYPYKPSKNWALIPDADSTLPLIIRQTITDPVFNYGDQTSGFTSQPNDYGRRDAPTSYFSYLLTQAHLQPTEEHTFALVGLENSMDDATQQEFARQLQQVSDWREVDGENAVMTAASYADFYTAKPAQPVTVYAGKDANNDQSEAWWITAPHYRARLRKDGNRLYMTDIRLYDKAFTDPYIDSSAQRFGYWVVPFLLDGSRFMSQEVSTNAVGSHNDMLTGRDEKIKEPTRFELPETKSKVVASRDQDCVVFSTNAHALARFCPDTFSLTDQAAVFTENGVFSPIIDVTKDAIVWRSKDKQEFIGVHITAINNLDIFQPFTHSELLVTERQQRFELLFPKLLHTKLDTEKTFVEVKKRYAFAAKNPVRLYLNPRDQDDNAIVLNVLPTVQTTAGTITSEAQAEDGVVPMVVNSDTPTQATVKIEAGEYAFSSTVYFAPDCARDIKDCIRHPLYIWWYVRTVMSNVMRAEAHQ